MCSFPLERDRQREGRIEPGYSCSLFAPSGNKQGATKSNQSKYQEGLLHRLYTGTPPLPEEAERWYLPKTDFQSPIAPYNHYCANNQQWWFWKHLSRQRPSIQLSGSFRTNPPFVVEQSSCKSLPRRGAISPLLPLRYAPTPVPEPSEAFPHHPFSFCPRPSALVFPIALLPFLPFRY